MSDAQTSTGTPAIKTLAIRISEDLRAQLDIIAQLNDRTVTDEIRCGLEAWIEHSKSDPTILARSESVRAEIEHDAETKRNAIAAIFAGSTANAGTKRPTRGGQGDE